MRRLQKKSEVPNDTPRNRLQPRGVHRGLRNLRTVLGVDVMNKTPSQLALSHGFLLTKRGFSWGLTRRNRKWLLLINVELQSLSPQRGVAMPPHITVPKPWTLEDVIEAMSAKCKELDGRVKA